jgi:pyridoxine kinase
MDDKLDSFCQHWKDNQIAFDAILVGYLGSISAIKMVEKILDELLCPEGISIVDPAMADHGKLYSGFDEEYATAMQQLCRKADIILPNVTETAMFAGQEYRETLDESYVLQLLNNLNHPCVILTGVGYGEDETGAAIYRQDRLTHYHHPKVGRNFHGTGDVFASSCCGALTAGFSYQDALKIATDFTVESMRKTVAEKDHIWYGVDFEAALPYLIRRIGK